jgi:hypothetical protein
MGQIDRIDDSNGRPYSELGLRGNGALCSCKSIESRNLVSPLRVLHASVVHQISGHGLTADTSCVASYESSAKFFSTRRPAAWLFSGWNWVANRLSRQIAAQKGSGYEAVPATMLSSVGAT